MGPRLLDMRWEDPDAGALASVARHLQGGGLVAMPTETVYGFGCVPEEAPLSALRRLKDRGLDKPFLLLIPGIWAVPQLDWVPDARELAQVFWPGALTLILADRGGSFPPGVRGPEGGVAVRVSPHPLAGAVVRALGGPMVSTSANAPGGQAALSAREALMTAEGLGAGEDLWVLDGGDLPPSDPSTIIDCTGPRPMVLRAGAVPTHRLRCVLPEIHDTA